MNDRKNRKMSQPIPTEAIADPINRACEILTSVAKSRTCVYRWLSLGFYPPDQDLVEAVMQGKLAAELTESTAWLGADQGDLIAKINKLVGQSDRPEDWQAEYQLLFGKSIQRVSPQESSYRWRDASHMLEAADSLAQALKQEYNQYGLAPIAGMEDSVAVECEFLSYLCERETENWALGSMRPARELRQQQRNFLADHLGVWFPEFSRNLIDRAAGSFYGHLASFGNTWFAFEHGAGYQGAA
jgi:TorA maturation chaperone TorD